MITYKQVYKLGFTKKKYTKKFGKNVYLKMPDMCYLIFNPKQKVFVYVNTNWTRPEPQFINIVIPTLKQLLFILYKFSHDEVTFLKDENNYILDMSFNGRVLSKDNFNNLKPYPPSSWLSK